MKQVKILKSGQGKRITTKFTFAIFVVILTSFASHSQEITQTIKGTVFDKESLASLPFATVVIQELNRAAATNGNGQFIIKNIPIGRYTIEARFLGYQPLAIPEVSVNSAKEVVLNIGLTEQSTKIDDVTVKAHLNKDMPINSMATISARSFNVEETRRYAGGIDDPARLASAFAGVSAGGNSQDNAIVIRGNAPNTVLWRVEGVDIANPNHFSGGNVAGGGFVSVISSQMLANSDFYTGAFPAEYGNALGGVFDIKLRTGNNERHEKTVQLGILGIDLSAEGPLSKNNKASYLFNYRYSTFGLLSNLGMMQTEQTPIYQDLSFKFVFPTKKSGVFSLWGLGGIDNMKDKAETDSTQWETDSDRMKNDWNESFGAIGVTHKYAASDKTFFSTSIVATGGVKDLTQERLSNNMVFENDMDLQSKNGKVSLNFFVNQKIGKKLNTRSGFNINSLFYNYNLSGTESSIPGTYKNYTNDSGQSFHIQAYTEFKYPLTHNLCFNGGVQAEYFALNDHYTIDPRAALSWNITDKHSLSVGFGKHSRLENLSIYFIKNSNDSEYCNKELDFSHAHHFVLSYNYRITDYLHLKVEPYYQYLYDVPGETNSSFSMINFKQDLTFQSALANNSVGENMGVDITLERFLKNNFYYMLTTSVFSSKYKADDNVWRNTRYNKKYVVNVLCGKEFFLGRNKNNILGVNLRGVISGGQYVTPVNQEASAIAQYTIYDNEHAFSQKDDMSKFFNLSITYRINKANHSSVFALQLNNVFGEEQYGEYEYNYNQKQCVRSSEVYKIPSISYKIEF